MKTQAVIGTLLVGALFIGASAGNTLAITYVTLDDPGSVNTYANGPLGTNGTYAFGISGSTIVGAYAEAAGGYHGFLATVPEPASMVFAALGFLVLVVFALRKSAIIAYPCGRTSHSDRITCDGLQGRVKEYPFKRMLTVLAGLAFLLTSAPARADLLYVANYANSTIERLTSTGAGSTFASSGVANPIGVAVDSAGNVYEGNYVSSSITKFTPGGVGSPFATALPNPLGLAIDQAGNLYAAIQSQNTIEKFTPAGVGTLFANTGLSNPVGLAFDSTGNLYAANYNSSSIEKFTPDGVGTLFASSGLVAPTGLAFDHAGNLYAANFGTNTIEKFTPGGAGVVFAATGIFAPWGLAFDRAGNLYVANQGSDTIAKVPPAGGTGTVFASGLSHPYLIAAAPVRSSTLLAAGFSTPIPGGSGNFIAFPNAPSLSGDNVAFVGNGSGGAQGIYAKFGVITPPQRIADLTTPILSGSGNFTSFYPSDPIIPGDPTVSGSNVAFFGAGSGGQQGIYVSLNGPPIKIADTATPIPNGTGNFTAFPSAPSISGDNVAFVGNGSGGAQGVFARIGVISPPQVVADTATPIPGGVGNFTAFPSVPSISGDNVAFVGNGTGGAQGVFARIGVITPPQVVADTATPIPNGIGNFTSFMGNGPPIAPAIDGAGIAFFGAGSGGQQGIYVSSQGPPIKVADVTTSIPNGSGSFTSFGNVSISATDVAFLGMGAGGQQGIYDMTGGTLLKVVDLTDIIGGRSITGLNLSSTGLSGNPVTYQATFADGSQGIFTSPVLSPGDFNADGQVTSADIPAMLAALTDLNAYQADHNLSDTALLALGDFDNSGTFTNADIQGLLDLLINGGSPSPAAPVPEPASAVLLAIGAIVFACRRRRVSRL